MHHLLLQLFHENRKMDIQSLDDSNPCPPNPTSKDHRNTICRNKCSGSSMARAPLPLDGWPASSPSSSWAPRNRGRRSRRTDELALWCSAQRNWDGLRWRREFDSHPLQILFLSVWSIHSFHIYSLTTEQEPRNYHFELSQAGSICAALVSFLLLLPASFVTYLTITTSMCSSSTDHAPSASASSDNQSYTDIRDSCSYTDVKGR